jgi:hypothetical protein
MKLQHVSVLLLLVALNVEAARKCYKLPTDVLSKPATPPQSEAYSHPPTNSNPPSDPPKDNSPPADPPKDKKPPADPDPPKQQKDNGPPSDPPKDKDPPAEPPKDITPPADPPKDKDPPADPPKDNTPPADPPKDNPNPPPKDEPVKETAAYAAPGGGNAGANKARVQAVGLTPGDLPRCVGSGHLDAGFPLNTDKLDAIFDHIGLPSIEQAVQKLDAAGAYNNGQSDQQKVQGAYLALSTLAKFKIHSPVGKSGDDNAKTFGALKGLGFANNVAGVDAKLTECGANKYGIPQDLMAYLWGSNEHHCLHAILFGNPDIKSAIHSTSLNDQAEDNVLVGQLGGFNDNGKAKEWGLWSGNSWPAVATFLQAFA